MKIIIFSICVASAGAVAEFYSRIDEISPDACNVDKSQFPTNEDGLLEYPQKPTIFSIRPTEFTALAELGSRDVLLEAYGSTTVNLIRSRPISDSESNIFDSASASTQRMPILYSSSLREYILNNVDCDTWEKTPNETYYLFGNNHGGIFSALSSSYGVPPCHHCSSGIKAIGIGGRHSGMSFHSHAAFFNEVIIGRKKWYLFPPHVTSVPGFHRNMTMKYWITEVYPTLTNDSDLLQCTLYPGDILYVPSFWSHATLNMDPYNFFVSLFLDLQLIKDTD